MTKPASAPSAALLDLLLQRPNRVWEARNGNGMVERYRGIVIDPIELKALAASAQAQEANCTEPNRAACPRMCMDFCNAAETAPAPVPVAQGAAGWAHAFAAADVIKQLNANISALEASLAACRASESRLCKELLHLTRCLRPWLESGHGVPGIATLNGADAAIDAARAVLPLAGEAAK